MGIFAALGAQTVPDVLVKEFSCGFMFHCPHCEAQQLSDKTLSILAGQENGTHACASCGKSFAINVKARS